MKLVQSAALVGVEPAKEEKTIQAPADPYKRHVTWREALDAAPRPPAGMPILLKRYLIAHGSSIDQCITAWMNHRVAYMEKVEGIATELGLPSNPGVGQRTAEGRFVILDGVVIGFVVPQGLPVPEGLRRDLPTARAIAGGTANPSRCFPHRKTIAGKALARKLTKLADQQGEVTPYGPVRLHGTWLNRMIIAFSAKGTVSGFDTVLGMFQTEIPNPAPNKPPMRSLSGYGVFKALGPVTEEAPTGELWIVDAPLGAPAPAFGVEIPVIPAESKPGDVQEFLQEFFSVRSGSSPDPDPQA